MEKDNLIDRDKYSYNKSTDQYIVPLKKLSKNIVVPGDKHRAMQLAYCGEDGRSVQEICYYNDFQESIFDEYKNVFGWIRKGITLPDEVIESTDNDSVVKSMMANRKFEIMQSFQKASWHETINNSNKWLKFQNNEFNPFEEALSKWTPKKIKIKEPLKDKRRFSYLLTPSDWHIGAEFKIKDSFRKNEWNRETFESFFEKYLEDNKSKIKQNLTSIDEIVVASMGDLMDGLRGMTEKGTLLNQEFSREEQFTYALDIITNLINNLIQFGIPIRIFSVKGNHDSLDNFILFETLSRVFPEVEFTNFQERCGFMVIKENLFLIDHGAHDTLKAKVPRDRKSREAYVLSLFSSRPDLMDACGNKYFLQGDQHHNELMEFNDFEFIIVSSPSSSFYADVNNWNSRPSQSSFLISDKGIVDIYRFFND